MTGGNRSRTIEEIPYGECVDAGAEIAEHALEGNSLNSTSAKTYRFSDVVRAIDTTPKSFRRWLITLGVESDDGGWLAFTPAQVLQYAIMRQLVTWGVSVPNAADLAVEAMVAVLTGKLSWEHETDALADEKVAASQVPRMKFTELFLKLEGHSIYVSLYEGHYTLTYEPPKLWKFGRGKTRPGSLEGAHLTIDLGALVYRTASRMTSGANPDTWTPLSDLD